MKLLKFLLVLLVCAVASLYVTSSVGASEAVPAVGDLPVHENELTNPTLVGFAGHKLFALDERSSRGFILNADGQRTGIFGGLGGEPGRLFHPSGMAVSGNNVVFFDQANSRIEYFSAEGKYEASFLVSRRFQSRTIAVDDQGNVYLNDPQMGSIVQVFDKKGKLVRTFGDLTKTSVLHQSSDKSKDAEQVAAANTVWIAVSHGGEVYIVFMTAPVMRKYSAEGKLIFERRITGPLAGTLEKLFWTYSSTRGGMSTGIGGAQVPYITKAIALNPKQDSVFILAAYDLFHKNSVIRFSTSGDQLSATPFSAEGQKGLLYTMCIGDNHTYFTTIFHPGIYRSDLFR